MYLKRVLYCIITLGHTITTFICYLHSVPATCDAIIVIKKIIKTSYKVGVADWCEVLMVSDELEHSLNMFVQLSTESDVPNYNAT